MKFETAMKLMREDAAQCNARLQRKSCGNNSEDRKTAIRMRDNGASAAQIAHKLQYSKNTVARWIK